jgi:hypothetical protein
MSTHQDANLPDSARLRAWLGVIRRRGIDGVVGYCNDDQ